MRYLFTNDTDAPIDKEIECVLSAMNEEGVDSDKYPKLMGYLERLNKLKAETPRREPVSWDTVAMIFGNLAGILVIVAYEQKHVMTSKGFSQILRPRPNN